MRPVSDEGEKSEKLEKHVEERDLANSLRL